MTIKIVTDSSADLPAQLVQELGITVVPLYVRFGDEVYRERVDITEDEFYQKLLHGTVHPVTIQPSPQDFANVYQKLSPEADGIVSIHISSKLSGTCNSALQGKKMIEKGCPIEVVDSQSITMGLGLIDIVAATAAKAGEGLQQVMEEAKQAIPNTRVLGLLDTLKYLLLGGRIGKAKALLGSILKVKPMIALKDGEVVPAGQARTRTKGIQRLFDFVKDTSNIQDLAILHSTTPDEAQTLAERVDPIFTKERIKFARLGTTLGVHGGPDFLAVAIRGL
ncbi:Protein DegV [subsurface metagenome]